MDLSTIFYFLFSFAYKGVYAMTKKLLILLCVALVLSTICACGSPMTLSDLKGRTARYNTTAYINKGGLLAVAEISQESPFESIVTYKAPAHLEGMQFVFTEDAAELKYEGLRYELLSSSLPQTAVARAALAIINQSIADGEMPLTKTDAGLVARGESAAGEFSLIFEPESAAITKRLLPAEELEIAFANFIYLDM
jgi:hypothetical protein